MAEEQGFEHNMHHVKNVRLIVVMHQAIHRFIHNKIDAGYPLHLVIVYLVLLSSLMPITIILGSSWEVNMASCHVGVTSGSVRFPMARSCPARLTPCPLQGETM